MLRRFISICVMIWAASAAHFVSAQDLIYYNTSQADLLAICQTYVSNVNEFCTPLGGSGNTVQLRRQGPPPLYFILLRSFGSVSDTRTCNAVGHDSLCLNGNTVIYFSCPIDTFWREDGTHCVTGDARDTGGYDQGGYDDNDCTPSACPTDPGWRDSEGYDYDGFDENGLDRGGNSAEQGGGYGGWAGSGGTPPGAWVPADPPDYGSGDNQDSNGVYQCRGAYPVSVSKSLVPGTVLDGLAGCGNGCQYQPSSIFYDFDYNEEVVLLEANGYPCAGGEPSLSSIFVHQHSPTESHPEPANHLNFCYAINGFLWCKAPEDHLPSCYFQRPDGSRSSSAPCSMVQNSGNPSSEDQQVCGTKNGIYQCVNDVTNCASYQGEIVCLDPDRVPIDSTSPDHPINGGNADGNPFNDVFADSTDVSNNGWTVQQRQQAALSAQEIARAIDTALTDDFAKLTNQSADIPDGEQTALNEAGLITDALQGVGEQDGIGFTVTPFGDINLFGSLLPTPQACELFTFVLIEDVGLEFSIDTCQLTLFKTLAEWLVYAMTVLAFYRILITVREVR